MAMASRRRAVLRVPHPSRRPNPHQIACAQCAQRLECVEQNRRSGGWLGLLLCPNCRSEYFYAYRSGQLLRRS
jgi:hypothetical protein